MRCNRVFPLAVVATLAACGGDDVEESLLIVTAYGEPFIEEGIPADEMADGWAIAFSTFDVTITGISVAGRAFSASAPVDLAVGSGGNGHEIGRTNVAAGSYSDAAFTIARVAIEGTATKDGATKSFAWTFDTATSYTGCETTTRVGGAAAATFEITVHADHLFYDSLVAEEPALRFQALADADTDGDGAITRAELESAGIGSYDAGSGGGVDNLWDWLVAQTATLGHVDGEGHCDSSRAN